MTTISRRAMLGMTAGGAAALALPRVPAFAQDKKIPIGLQLYSVRNDFAADPDATLKAVADMGIQGVEFAGYGKKYGSDPAGLRKKLDELGLKAAGTHIGAASFMGDAQKKTIEFHKQLGCSFLICPGDGRFMKADESKAFAEAFSKAAEQLKPEGMACGFHNHDREFGKAEGDKTWWDLFVERTSKDVILQIDFGHAIFAGVDCVALVKKAAGRVRSCHVKGRLPRGAKDKQPFVGLDAGDWKAILGACYETGGTDWFLLEQEDYPNGRPPMDCVKMSFEGTKKVLAEMGK
jgi:sugar phosphate isomerase/epimerase